MPSYVRPGIRKCAKNRALSCGVSCSTKAGIPWRPAETRSPASCANSVCGAFGAAAGRSPPSPPGGRAAGSTWRGAKFAARAPNRLHVADITYVRLAYASFTYAAFVTDAYARRIVGWAVASTMRAGELPLQAPEQAIAWARAHGGTGGACTIPATARSI